jgi:hypothetical protein
MKPRHFRNLQGARRVKTGQLKRLREELPDICDPAGPGS